MSPWRWVVKPTVKEQSLHGVKPRWNDLLRFKKKKHEQRYGGGKSTNWQNLAFCMFAWLLMAYLSCSWLTHVCQIWSSLLSANCKTVSTDETLMLSLFERHINIATLVPSQRLLKLFKETVTEQRREKSDLLLHPGSGSSPWIHFHRQIFCSSSASLYFWRKIKTRILKLYTFVH